MEDRAAALAQLAWTGRAAEWNALVCLHSGVFTWSQYGFYFQTGGDRKSAGRFVRTLLDRGVAVEDERGIFPGGARAVHIANKPIYRALGIENSKHRRGAKETTTQVLMRRLLSLDYVMERATVPYRVHGAAAKEQKRFIALNSPWQKAPLHSTGDASRLTALLLGRIWPICSLVTPCQPGASPVSVRRGVSPRAAKFPVAVDEKTATFTYVDPGLTTDSELRAWGKTHAPLWAALRGADFRRADCRHRRGRAGR